MPWAERAKNIARVVVAAGFCALVWIVVQLAFESQQQPTVSPRTPIASITPTDPMAR